MDFIRSRGRVQLFGVENVGPFPCRLKGVSMQSRRLFLALLFLVPPLCGYAQPVGAAFVGEWQGEVPGIGDALLVISAVRQGGQVEGRMEFPRTAARESFISKFADKAEPSKNTNSGFISGSTLIIKTALGGRYDLQRDGDRLTGTYTRATDYNVPISFKKS